MWEGRNPYLYFLLKDYRFTPARFLPHRVLRNISSSETAFDRNEDLWKMDLSKDVARIKCPTLILWGEADTVFPLPNARWLLRQLGTQDAAKRLVVVKQATHFPQNEQPERVASAMNSFVSKHASR